VCVLKACSLAANGRKEKECVYAHLISATTIGSVVQRRESERESVGVFNGMQPMVCRGESEKASDKRERECM